MESLGSAGCQENKPNSIVVYETGYTIVDPKLSHGMSQNEHSSLF